MARLEELEKQVTVAGKHLVVAEGGVPPPCNNGSTIGMVYLSQGSGRFFGCNGYAWKPMTPSSGCGEVESSALRSCSEILTQVSRPLLLHLTSPHLTSPHLTVPRHLLLSPPLSEQCPDAESGIYWIDPDNSGLPFEVYW
jgi:hypothetical protein